MPASFATTTAPCGCSGPSPSAHETSHTPRTALSEVVSTIEQTGPRRSVILLPVHRSEPAWAWLVAQLKLAEPLMVNVSGHSFPILWSIIGAALFVVLIHLISRR